MMMRIRNFLGLDQKMGAGEGIATKGTDSNFGKGISSLTTPQNPGSIAYKNNVWVFSAVRVIANSISQVPIYYKDKRGKSHEDVTDPWAEVLDNPNPLMTRGQLIKATSIYYELYGQAFWMLLGADMKPISNPKDAPMYIFPINPRAVSADYDRTTGFFSGWKATINGNDNEYKPWQILRFFEIDPDSIFDGVTPLEPSKTSLKTDTSAHAMNQSFFDNGGRRDGFLKYDGEDPMTKEELAEFRTLWDTMWGGPSNAWKTPMLADGFSYEEMGDNAKDMDFYNLLKMTREEIIAAFGVPKHKVTLYEDLNYATAEVMDIAFWTDNLIPKISYIEEVINKKMFAFSKYSVCFDLSEIHALQAALKNKTVVAKNMFQLGYSINEINDTLNLGLDEIPQKWADEAVDVRQAADSQDPFKPKPGPGSTKPGKTTPGKDPKERDRDNDKPREDDRDDNKSLYTSREKMANDFVEIMKSNLVLTKKEDGGIRILTERAWEGDQDAADALYAKYQEEVVEPNLPAYEKAVGAWLDDLEKVQLAKMNAATPKSAGSIYERKMTDGEVDQALFNADKWSKAFSKMSEPFINDTWERGIQWMQEETGEELSSEMLASLDEGLVGMVASSAMAVGIMHKQIEGAMREGAASQETLAEIKDRVSGVLSGQRGRKGLISFVQLASTSQRVRYDAATLMNGGMATIVKKWTATSGEPRKSHSAHNSLPAMGLSHQYAPGLRYPYDHNCGDASEIVNCKCHLLVKRA